MKIIKARIKNYKSYLDSEEIEFAPGMNVIVGKNDAGKSALIEALSLSFLSKPHRTLITAPFPSSLVKPDSEVELTFQIFPEDIQAYLSQYKELYFQINPNFHTNAVLHTNSALSQPFQIETKWVNGSPYSCVILLEELRTGSSIGMKNLGYPTSLLFGTGNLEGSNRLAQDALRDELRQRIYGFRAERLGRSNHPAQGSSTLTSDAGNLSEVLNSLASGNPSRYAVLMKHLKTVFPEIEWVTTEIISGHAAAKVWNLSTSTERKDLAISLFDSGTGLAQVLAILYVVVTSDESKLLCIDEPQSFLHPGAFRKLFEILRAYPQHQYIVTTHSPSAILTNDRVFIAKRQLQETKIVQLSAASQESSRDFLLEVGARLSDVFGADSVVWVEGKTEEHCFPIILREVAKNPLAGTVILGLVQTGDLNKRDASRILSIYANLSRGPTLMPQSLAFVLDDEGRPLQEKVDLNKQAGGRIRWLPRRLFENYLVDAAAIADVINAGDPIVSVTEKLVADWLHSNARARKYWKLPGEVAAYPSVEWSRNVHAAELLTDAFTSLTDARLTYDKVKHGMKLTELLAARKTLDIKELANFLVGIFDSKSE